MSIDEKDFEFYTFFTGLKQNELAHLRKLLQSFPYFDTHRINVIDNSQAVKAYLEAGHKKFYLSWRTYLIEPKCDLNYTECEQLFSEYSDVVNRILEPEKLFHGQAIDKVMTKYAKSPFVVIMDSDIVYTSDHYLPHMISLCNRYNYNELAALGTLYQKVPFHLTLHPEIPPQLYQIFLSSSNENINWKGFLGIGKYLVMTAVKHFFKSSVKTKRVNNLGRFPQFHPALLLINREIFNRHKMSFHNLYLDALDKKNGYESKHRIIGDNGASFLYQCAMASKQIVSIDFDEYIVHSSSVSVADKEANGWSWFNKEFHDDPLP